jgi:hypothetical protein
VGVARSATGAEPAGREEEGAGGAREEQGGMGRPATATAAYERRRVQWRQGMRSRWGRLAGAAVRRGREGGGAMAALARGGEGQGRWARGWNLHLQPKPHLCYVQHFEKKNVD